MTSSTVALGHILKKFSQGEKSQKFTWESNPENNFGTFIFKCY